MVRVDDRLPEPRGGQWLLLIPVVCALAICAVLWFFGAL